MIGGGFYFPNYSKASGTTESHWADSHTAWVSSNPDGVHSYAVCADKNAVQAHYVTASWSGVGKPATCTGSGQELSGGGFKLTSGTVSANYAENSQSWNVQSVADQGAGTSYGVCVTNGKYDYESTAGETYDVTLECPTGDSVVGGGFAQNPGENVTFIVYRSKFSNGGGLSGWRSSVIEAYTFNDFAVCAKD